jgi:hypothetical protein
LAKGNGWVTQIDEGLVIADEAQGQTLFAAAKQHEAECIVIDPQLIDVKVQDGHTRPVAIREAIRAFGPTVRTDLT